MRDSLATLQNCFEAVGNLAIRIPWGRGKRATRRTERRDSILSYVSLVPTAVVLTTVAVIDSMPAGPVG